MKVFQQAALIALLSLPCVAQQVVDRMVAVVNNHVITQSDWDEQARFEALADGRAFSDKQQSAAVLERLVDRVLISEHLAGVNFQHATPEQVAQQIAEIRKQFPPAQSQTDEAWRKTLAGYSIPEEDMSQIVAEQLDVLRFVELRFRPSVQVAPEEIDKYYRQTLVPELKKTGTNESEMPSVQKVQERIRELLVEQRVNDMLNSWVQSLRAQANIQRLVTVTPSGASHQSTTTQ